jgi:hypothetical protein
MSDQLSPEDAEAWGVPDGTPVSALPQDHAAWVAEGHVQSSANMTDEELHASFLSSEQYKETPTERYARQLAESDEDSL